jgi:hypothetical protein
MKDFFQQLHLAVGGTPLRVLEETPHLGLPAVIDFPQRHTRARLIEVGGFEVSDEQPSSLRNNE